MSEHTKHSYNSAENSTPLDKTVLASLLALDPRTLSKCVTYLESEHWSELKKVLPYWLWLKEHKHQSVKPIVAFTGAPGVGKSSLINAYGEYLLKKNSKTHLGIFTIDPAGHLSGGSLLGDKVRMSELAKESRVFIRPSSSKDSLTSVATKSIGVLKFFSHLDFSDLWIETIGIGQREKELSTFADLTLLVISPGAGDELQAFKKGLLELVDIIVINKNDGELAPLAKQALRDHQSSTAGSTSREGQKVVLVSSMEKKGFEDLESAISECIEKKNKLPKKLSHFSLEELILLPEIKKVFLEFIEKELKTVLFNEFDFQKLLTVKHSPLSTEHLLPLLHLMVMGHLPK